MEETKQKTTSVVDSIGDEVAMMTDRIKNGDALAVTKMLLVEYGLRAVAALLTLAVGFWLINRVTNFLTSNLESRDFDTTLKVYLSRLIGIGLKVLLIISVAGMVGIHTTSFMAVLGAAGLAIGLALQGSLSNFAGGVLMLTLRPFQVGDEIVAQGEQGIVTAIDIFTTTLVRSDNCRVLIPNGPLIGGIIINLTAEGIRRIEVAVGIGYGDNIAQAQEALVKMALQDPRVLKNPEPIVGVKAFGASSVDLVFRVWCNIVDYPQLSFDIHKKTKETLDASKISIPFPQHEVRVLKDV